MRTTKLFLGLLLVAALAACGETVETDAYHDWRARNEAFIDSLETVFMAGSDPTLYRIQDMENKDSYVYFKSLETGDATQPSPLYTSSVDVFYRGMLIDEAVFAACPSPKHLTTQYKYLTVFDKNFTDADPSPFDTPMTAVCRTLISGWIYALQYMHPGDRWEVYIPWVSGYGEQSSGAIPPYSALVFDVALESVELYP